MGIIWGDLNIDRYRIGIEKIMSLEYERQKEMHEDGKPYQCDFQAGMFWCQNRTLYEVFRPEQGGDGWECSECKAFHISKKQHLKNLLDLNRKPDGDFIDKP